MSSSITQNQSHQNTDHEHNHDHHDHDHHHDHGHTHDPQKIKAVMNRLSRSAGHINACKQMLEDGRDCSDVLIQLAAVRSEINNAGKLLLKEHMDSCIVEAVSENDHEAIEKMRKAIDMFMK